jgi:hypothetical protein
MITRVAGLGADKVYLACRGHWMSALSGGVLGRCGQGVDKATWQNWIVGPLRSLSVITHKCVDTS